MAQLRRSMTTNLGDTSDKDIIEFAKMCNEQGVNDSTIIKNCLRYWITTVGFVAPIATVTPSTGVSNMKDYILNILKESKEIIPPIIDVAAPKVKRKYVKKATSKEPKADNKDASKDKVIKEVKNKKEKVIAETKVVITKDNENGEELYNKTVNNLTSRFVDGTSKDKAE